MDLGGATQDSHMRMPINLSYGFIHESSAKFKMQLSGGAGLGGGGMQAASSSGAAAGGLMQAPAGAGAIAHIIPQAAQRTHEEESSVPPSVVINGSSSCSQDGVPAPTAEAIEAKSKKGVRYRECLKNHAANIGGHALDGCGEFMASGEEGSLEALMCAACGCHRNFHRREAEADEGFCSTGCKHQHQHLRGLLTHDARTLPALPLPPPPAAAAAAPPLALPPAASTPPDYHYPHQQQAQHHHMIGLLGTSNPPPNPADCADPQAHRHFQYPHPSIHHVAANSARPPYGSYVAPPHHPYDRHQYHSHPYSLLSSSAHHHLMMKKRFRTKFSVEQKDRMLAFAEKLGWRIQKQDEAAVQQFCGDVGVRRHVLKVWMHNNKNTMAKKISPNEMPAGYLDSGSASPTNSGSGGVH